ncbi:hypothetical protein ASPFODRAFT_83516 [Aspergillus luchuensis CBS 106.47]|uniref:Major facilitator superfamily (MFS) profile domain-containing protein n=1 Tax=Aspergillus luchuensis (strain CBS 106.47) TaxID=1137211 RepID=A0A1M3T8E3_ASPLC|nr:hypothetical protein ASPFODRAFT_83516 [Aspergillus luchuensis CBS 106.47]
MNQPTVRDISSSGSNEKDDTAPGHSIVTYPEGGFRAWMVVLGAFCILFCTFGYLNTWGAYQDYYVTHQLSDYSSSALAWIGSVQVFLLYGGGVVGGPLFDRYGAKVIILPAILFVFSVMMASICKQYYQYMLAQGILGGLCCGLMFNSAMASHRSNWLFARGGVIFPIALNRMFENNHLGFGWSVRIVGFIILALLIIAMSTLRERLPSRKGPFLVPSAFTNLNFVGTTIALFFMIWGMFTPFFYIEIFATYKGMGATLATYMLPILNAASIFGRLLPGFIADKFGPFTTLFISATVTSVLLFSWIAVSSNAGIIVFSIFYGSCSGAIISLMSPCIAKITPEPQLIGTYLGMALFVVAIAGLTGTPICGALIDRYNSFTQAAAFSGSCVMFGAVVILLLRLNFNRHLRVPI